MGSSPCRRTNPVSQWSLCLFHLWTRSACNAAGHLYATIAQVAEHLPFKQGVVGSNPACRTNRYSLLYLLSASKCVTCNPCLSPIFQFPRSRGRRLKPIYFWEISVLLSSRPSPVTRGVVLSICGGIFMKIRKSNKITHRIEQLSNLENCRNQ